MARQYFSTEQVAEDTTTSATYDDAGAGADLVFTPDISSTYVLIWNSLARINSVTARGQTRFHHDTATTVLSQHRNSAKDTTDYWSRGGIAFYVEPGSPAAQTFSIEHASHDGATTVGNKESRITAIKLGANDASIESNAESTNATTTFSTKATLTFTPGSQGDYLVMASADIYNNDDLGDPYEVKLVENAVAYGLHIIANDGNDGAPADGGGKYNWMTFTVINLTAAEKSFTLQYRNTVGTDTIGIENARIVALRLSDFPDYNFNESRTRATTASTSAQTKATVTDTFAAVGGLILGCGLLDHSATTSSANCRLVENGSTIGADMVREPNVTGTGENYPFLMAVQKTLTASSIIYNTAYFAEANTTGFQESSVVVLQLEDTPAGGTAVKDIITSGIIPFAR